MKYIKMFWEDWKQNKKPLHIEYNFDLKHWGRNFEYCHREATPYLRIYFIFIYIGQPIFVD